MANTIRELSLLRLFGFAFLLACVVTHRSTHGEAPTGLTNLNFESGKEAWAVWYSDDPKFAGPKFEWTIDNDAHAEGAASMRVVADDRQGRAFVHQSTKHFAKGVKYQLSYAFKFSTSEMYDSCVVSINLARLKPDGKRRDVTQIDPVTFYRRGENGWLWRTGYFVVPQDCDELQIGLSVKNTLGTVWFDDVQLAVVPAGELRAPSMFHYAPGQVELGPPMVERFTALRNKQPSLSPRAKVYNDLLVQTAGMTDELQRLARAAHYLEAHGKSISILPEQKEVEQLERQLDEVYRAYVQAFRDRTDANLSAFDKAAEAVVTKFEPVRKGLEVRGREIQAAAKERGLDWKPPIIPRWRQMAISSVGKPNQLIFGTVSLQSHYDLEEPLGVNRLFASSLFEVPGKGPGDYDFSGPLTSWAFFKRLGSTHSSIGTAFGVHNNQVAPAWFLKKYSQDEDIMCIAADGKKALRPSWSMGAPLNTWRPEVREMTADLIAQIGKTFRDESQYLFYVVAPENGGPYFPSENNNKSIGYNKSALPDFHAWLKRRYGTLEPLNQAWKTKYESFEAIEPPPDLLIVDEWPRPHPLAYEFQSWRNDHHHHWLKLLYDEFKKADPNKPVMADHSALLSQVDGSRIFDTVDILSVHHTPQASPTLAPVYAYSMNRSAKKHVALYENGWGCAEPMPHHASEIEQRAALTKYLYRLTAWGMHTQMWWYAYTSNDYMIRFNGNWFDPVLGLSTLRYSAAGLPIAKARVKRQEDILLNSTIEPARVVIVQPVTSMLFQNYWNESYIEMERLHELLYGRNNHHEVLPETFFLDGRAKLDDFQVVVLPYAPYFPDKFAEPLREWVKKGGTLVALGPCGLFDKFGFEQAAFFKEAFGAELPTRFTKPYRYWDRYREWRWGWNEKQNEAPLVEKPFGEGKIVLTLRSLDSLAMRAGPAACLVEIIEARAPRAASCDSNQFEMTIHVARDGRKYLYVFSTSTERPITDTVTLAGEFKSGLDLDMSGGFPVAFKPDRGRTTFSLRLGPGEFTLIELRD